MRYLSVCSGIEAATVAWHPLGWEAAAFSDIEKFPCAVLRHHYPDVPLHGDFTTIGADEYGPIDLLVGGTPCQSFSIAGLRGGLDDDRGNLALEYLRLADRTRPRWLVWENVPGVLSSNGGRDFGAILGGMAELGYGFAYRVLDAQFFGVPQRRRRVFVVGHLGSWTRPAAVLFERHSLQGNPAPRREKGEVAPTVPARSTGGGGLGTDFDCDGGLIPQDCDGVVGALCRQDHGGVDTQTALGGYLIPTATGFSTQQEPKWAEELCPTLTVPSKSGGGQPHCVAINENQQGAVWASDTFQALNKGGGKPGQGYPAVAFSIMPMNSGKDYKARETDVAQPIMASGPVGGNQGGDYICQSTVRRLTPRECERLQGFPDDYTRIPWRGKDAADCPDGPRYKALGNSMAVPVMRWIGERIVAVESLQRLSPSNSRPDPIEGHGGQIANRSGFAGPVASFHHANPNSREGRHDHV